MMRQKKLLGWGLLIMATVFAWSCRKGDPFGIIQSDNAPPTLQNIRDFVISEFEDTLDLKVRFNTGSDVVWDRYEYAWTCIQKPDGVPAPLFSNAGSYETIAYGLKPGAYTFNIVVSNKKGNSAKTFNVNVLRDTLKGKTIVVPNQSWLVVDSVTRIGTVTWTRWNPKLISSPERPDLFFRKLSGMYLSYRNEGETEWHDFDNFEKTIVSGHTLWTKYTNAPEEWKTLHGKKAELRIYFR